MADAQQLAAPIKGLSEMPVVRQVGALVGIAASVALGVAVVLWSQTPNYSLLYGSLAGKDASEVVAALQQSNIPYRIDAVSGAVMVPAEDVHEARMKLAADGLPKGTGVGYELLEEQVGFGTSRFIENIRYQRAIEGELARSIGNLTNIEQARVHLAIPRQSAFVRKRDKVSASVIIDLYPGRVLEPGQVESIVHLVASSVPGLETGQITVVDDKGQMLSNGDQSGSMAMSSKQFDFARKLEASYVERIEAILSPVVGARHVRATVAVDLELSAVDQTQELFNPDQQSLRSEQVHENESVGAARPQGIPGALSNQPPVTGTVPEDVVPAEGVAPDDVAAAVVPPPPKQTTMRATRNYELDRTISHTRRSPGAIRRLSVAVVVDDRQQLDDADKLQQVPRTPEELDGFTQLVREAVGFNAVRGDSVKVTNIAFMPAEQLEPLPEPPIWEQAWLWDTVKQVLGGLVVLFLLFGVLRPTMRGLVARRAPSPAASGMQSLESLTPEQLVLVGQQASSQPSYEESLELARKAVENDPKRVAQLMKTWVAE